MSPGRRRAGDGPSKTQRLMLVAARSGKLFETSEGLCLRQDGRSHPVKAFSGRIVAVCIAAGWAQRMGRDDGEFRIMTTLAGDAALDKALRMVKRGSIDADWRREALR